MAGRRDPVLASWNGHQGMSLVEGLLSASPDQDGIWDLALSRQLGKQCHKTVKTANYRWTAWIYTSC